MSCLHPTSQNLDESNTNPDSAPREYSHRCRPLLDGAAYDGDGAKLSDSHIVIGGNHRATRVRANGGEGSSAERVFSANTEAIKGAWNVVSQSELRDECTGQRDSRLP